MLNRAHASTRTQAHAKRKKQAQISTHTQAHARTLAHTRARVRTYRRMYMCTQIAYKHSAGCIVWRTAPWMYVCGVLHHECTHTTGAKHFAGCIVRRTAPWMYTNWGCQI